MRTKTSGTASRAQVVSRGFAAIAPPWSSDYSLARETRLPRLSDSLLPAPSTLQHVSSQRANKGTDKCYGQMLHRTRWVELGVTFGRQKDGSPFLPPIFLPTGFEGSPKCEVMRAFASRLRSLPAGFQPVRLGHSVTLGRQKDWRQKDGSPFFAAHFFAGWF